MQKRVDLNADSRDGQLPLIDEEVSIDSIKFSNGFQQVIKTLEMSVNYVEVNDSPFGSLVTSANEAGILRIDNKVFDTTKQSYEVDNGVLYAVKLIIGDRG